VIPSPIATTEIANPLTAEQARRPTVFLWVARCEDQSSGRCTLREPSSRRARTNNSFSVDFVGGDRISRP
jgi:hypothetical protein